MENNKEYIMNDLQNKYNFLENTYEIFGVFLQGSQNYGLAMNNQDYTSDIDAKAIVIPTFKDFVSGKSPESTTKHLKDNSQIDVKDIRKMFELFEKQNINVLEILFTEYFIINPKYQKQADKLFEMADEIALYNRNALYRTISGMSMEKLKALKHPYPSIKDKIEKYGYDCKQLHHIVRLNIFINSLIEGKSFRECLIAEEPDLQYLKHIKIPGNISLATAELMAIQYDTETKELKDKHVKLPDKVNKETVNKLKDLIYETFVIKFKEEILGE